MSPVGLARLPGRSFALNSYEKFHPGFRDEKAKDPGKEFWGQIRETKQTWRNTKVLTLAIIASATLKAVLYYCSQMQCL